MKVELCDTDLKEKILHFISLNNITQLKFWLLDLPIHQKQMAFNYIVQLGQDAMLGKHNNSLYPMLQNFREQAIALCELYFDEKELFDEFEKLREKYRLGTTKLMHIYKQKKMFLYYMSQSSKPYQHAMKKLIKKYMDFETKHDLFDADSWIFD